MLEILKDFNSTCTNDRIKVEKVDKRFIYCLLNSNTFLSTTLKFWTQCNYCTLPTSVFNNLQSGDHSEIIKHMARLVDSIEVPAAKAAILWVMGEYCERVPKIAPDVLRKMAKSFTNEDPAVKMQVMSGI